MVPYFHISPCVRSVAVLVVAVVTCNDTTRASRRSANPKWNRNARARRPRPLATMSAAACVGRKSAVDEEDASELRLGPDFNEANCLSLAEVKIVIESKRDDDREKAEETSTTRTRVFEKTLAYVQRFSGNITDVATSAIRNLHVDAGLHDFEGAVISNLTPQDWDEAKTLIPSLEQEDRELTEEKIQTMLDEMANVRKFE